MQQRKLNKWKGEGKERERGSETGVRKRGKKRDEIFENVKEGETGKERKVEERGEMKRKEGERAVGMRGKEEGNVKPCEGETIHRNERREGKGWKRKEGK